MTFLAYFITVAISSLMGYGIGYARRGRVEQRERLRIARIKRLTPPLHGPIRFSWAEDPDAAIDALIAATTHDTKHREAK